MILNLLPFIILGALAVGMLLRISYNHGFAHGYKASTEDGQREQTIWARRRSGERK